MSRALTRESRRNPGPTCNRLSAEVLETEGRHSFGCREILSVKRALLARKAVIAG
jgi:hypothetical protein